MIVLDAAALVDIVADRSTREWVLERLEGEQISAPAHQPAEVLSAITRLERAGDLSTEAAEAALGEAQGLPQRFHPLDRQMVRRAYSLRERVRVLDGLYVALTESLEAVLVTTDGRLGRAKPPCAIELPPGEATDAPTP